MNKKELLKEYKEGKISLDLVLKELETQNLQDTGYAMVDLDREKRSGAPEVIYGKSKTPEQIEGIAKIILKSGSNLLATQVAEDVWEKIKPSLKGVKYDPISKTMLKIQNKKEKTGLVAVLCAGTSDLPVADEAAVTLDFLGHNAERIYDVGVAGIHRLFRYSDKIREADVVIVIAGMEGALASVVGGLVKSPVIAVPTSVGYGASFGGVAALLAMLNSCANGITVVNIDNGFGSACAAGRILKSKK